MQFTFDPAKDAANLLKHGLSLRDAPLVFKAPDKLTLASPRDNETRQMDIALVEMVEMAGVVLVLTYVLRMPNEVRAISLRRASKQERRLYAHWQENTD